MSLDGAPSYPKTYQACDRIVATRMKLVCETDELATLIAASPGYTQKAAQRGLTLEAQGNCVVLSSGAQRFSARQDFFLYTDEPGVIYEREC